MTSDVVFKMHTSSDYEYALSSSLPSSPVISPIDLADTLPTPPCIPFENLTPDDMGSACPPPRPRVKHESIKKTWGSMSEMMEWIAKGQEEKMFSFAKKDKPRSRGSSVEWIGKYVYVCSRGSSGGKKAYTKKCNWTRKIPHKKTGCHCRLRITEYKDHVEGTYTPGHNHKLGTENARFTAISESTRRGAEVLLRSGMEPRKVVRKLT